MFDRCMFRNSIGSLNIQPKASEISTQPSCYKRAESNLQKKRSPPLKPGRCLRLTSILIHLLDRPKRLKSIKAVIT